MHEVRDPGIREVVERALAHVGDGPTYLTVDVEVLRPFVDRLVIDCQLPQAEALLLEAEGDLEPVRDELDEIGQAFASLERIIRRGQDEGTFRAEVDARLAAWMLYGALEEVLTGWVLGQLPDDADAVSGAEQEITKTFVGGLCT